jgi:hypothetical protein
MSLLAGIKAIAGNWVGNQIANLLCDEAGRLYVTADAAHPLCVQTPIGKFVAVSEINTAQSMIADVADTTNTVAVTSTAATYRLPAPGALYTIMAHGVSIYIRSGGLVATAAVGGYGLLVETGQCITLRLIGPTLSFISHADDAQTGVVTFLLHQGL